MTTADLLYALLRTNLAAGAGILIVTALRKPARRLAGARQAYSLWLLPLLAMAAGLFPARQVTVTLPPPAPLAEASRLIVTRSPAANLHHLDPSHLLLALWLAGALIAVLIVTVLQMRFASAAARGDIGPAVVGVLRPRIIMPSSLSEIFDAKERALVLAHEEAHIARQDSRINGLSVLFQCLFWFNPLVHLAAHLARIDQEMACDEAVITRFPGARRTYAQALVKAQLATRPLPLGCCWPSGTEHPLEERIAMLKTKTKSRPHRLVAGSALTILCAGAAFAAWAAQPPSVAVVHAVATAATTPVNIEVIVAKPALQPKPTPVAPPAQGADAPAQVCVTNACMPKSANDSTIRSISDAIAKGDAAAVVAMGGSGKDAIAALLNGPEGAKILSNGQHVSDILGELASQDSVTIAADPNIGQVMLVGVTNGDAKMALTFPELGSVPAGAPIFTSTPSPGGRFSLHLSPAGGS